MNFFKSKIELSQEEKKILKIVNGLLKSEDTIIKMTPITDKYYITNDIKKCYILCDHSYIKIIYDSYTLQTTITGKFEVILSNKIKKAIEEDRQKFENEIFNIENNIINKMVDDLSDD